MKIVNGIYTSAKIFTDNVEEYALAQLQMLCDHEAFQNSKIRIMPDVHPGKVGTVGFTATVVLCVEIQYRYTKAWSLEGKLKELLYCENCFRSLVCYCLQKLRKFISE